MATTEKPSITGMKRAFIILALMIVSGVGVIVAVAYMQSSRSKEAPKTEVGRVIPSGSVNNEKLPPATQEMLDRVQSSEAETARRQGKSYIPDARLGPPDQYGAPPQSNAPNVPPTGPGPSALDQYPNTRAPANTQQKTREEQAIEEGLVRQLELILKGMAPATQQVVAIKAPEKKEDNTKPQSVAGASDPNANLQGATPGADSGRRGKEIIGADVIVPALITTAIDTDVTKFVMAEITGGKLKGATLRGTVLPLTQSGDVQDVGIKFTSMRFADKSYSIDAIALNENTANDALGGDIDRKVFSRYVMPILLASLSGASAYFTSLGTPATSLAVGTQTGNNAVIVNQNAVTTEQAMNQGIGSAANKTSQIATKIVEKQAAQPNRVTVPAMTTVGVIFNNSVFESTPR